MKKYTPLPHTVFGFRKRLSESIRYMPGKFLAPKPVFLYAFSMFRGITKKYALSIACAALLCSTLSAAEPSWMIPLRDAVYAQNVSLDRMLLLYNEAKAAASSRLSGQGLYLALSRCEYFLGRAYQDKGRNKEAAASYDAGIDLAKKAQTVAPTAEGYLLLSLAIGQNCMIRSTPWVMANGLKVEDNAKKTLSLDPNNVPALYQIAARYAFGPMPFGDYPRGVTMMKQILANHEKTMQKNELFDVYSAIGYAYLQDKKPGEARSWLDKAQACYPTNKFVQGLIRDNY
jgi:tetratricopeptide (TPR) repeat protein